jgi:hypothetical protein
MKRRVDLPTKNLYEFGFGLSYTKFAYSKPNITKSVVGQTESTQVSITLTNTGKRAGGEIVQLYINDAYSQVTRPVKELKAFERIHLASGESKVVSFTVLIADTAQAVKELDQNGINTYCINLDPDADEYVQDIFGNQYTVIDNVESPPEKLPQLFMALTK